MLCVGEMDDGYGDGKGGGESRPELFVKGWVANGSKESRRGERVISRTWLLNERPDTTYKIRPGECVTC